MKKVFAGDRGEHNNNLNFVLYIIYLSNKQRTKLQHVNTRVYTLFAVISFTKFATVAIKYHFKYSVFHTNFFMSSISYRMT